jgi:hypothetical protein
MKTYSLHYIYRLLFAIFLIIMTDSTIRELLNPNYSSPGPMPRAMGWYICAFLWYALFTMAYKVQIDDNNNITVTSLLRKITLRPEDVIKIKDYRFFLKIFNAASTFYITTLIDGVANVKTIFAHSNSPVGVKSDINGATTEDRKKIRNRTILTYLIIILLIAFAIYIEFDENTRRIKRQGLWWNR